MKKLLLVLGIICLLSGCSLVPDSYASIVPHTEVNTQPTDTQAITVDSATEMKNAVLSLVEEGAEGATLMAAYEGDPAADFRETVRYLTESNPASAYLLESISHVLHKTGDAFQFDLLITYRRSPDTLTGVQTVRNAQDVRGALMKALSDCAEGLVLRMTSYAETDFSLLAQECFQNAPTRIMEMPKIQWQLYPDTGAVRIAELRFTYSHEPGELLAMQTAVKDILDAANAYVRYVQGDVEKASLLYSFLAERHDYLVGTSDTPAYSLLISGVGDSLSFARIYEVMCQNAGLNCTLVDGQRDGAPYYWNRLTLSDGEWDVDVLANVQSGLRDPVYMDKTARQEQS